MESNNYPPYVDLSRIFSYLIKNLVSIVLAALLGASIGIAYFYSAQINYRVNTLFVPVDSAAGNTSSLIGGLGGLSNLVGLDARSGDTASIYIAIMKSRQFLLGILDDEGLREDLYPELWNIEKDSWIEELDFVPSYLAMYRNLLDRITIKYDFDTKVYTLELLWPNRDKAAYISNLLVERINARARSDRIIETTRKLELLRRELENTQVKEMRSLLFDLVTTQVSEKTIAQATSEFVFRVVDPAVEPDKPHWPKIGACAAAGFVAGGTLGIIVLIMLFPKRSRK